MYNDEDDATEPIYIDFPYETPKQPWYKDPLTGSAQPVIVLVAAVTVIVITGVIAYYLPPGYAILAFFFPLGVAFIILLIAASFTFRRK